MPLILVTNDDGVFSEGIKLLAASLSEVAEVIVVAPDREQSATGHSLTLHRPLRMQQIESNVYSVDGTSHRLCESWCPLAAEGSNAGFGGFGSEFRRQHG